MTTTHTKPLPVDLTKFEKVVVSVGVGKLRNMAQFDDKVLPDIERDIALITGQKPSRRPAKQSVASFKTREGDVVGLQVTLRQRRMADFLTKVIGVVLPRVKDFRGLDTAIVDQHGNLNIGFREHVVFAEVDPEKVRVMFGVQVTIVPRDRNRDAAIDFYRSIGLPLRNSEPKKAGAR
jgi:large subunit ribosomal protein L5